MASGLRKPESEEIPQDIAEAAAAKAPITDAKKAPQTATADLAAGGGAVGTPTVAATIDSTKDALTPLAGSSKWADVAIMLLVVIGAAITVGGVLWRDADRDPAGLHHLEPGARHSRGRGGARHRRVVARRAADRLDLARRHRRQVRADPAGLPVRLPDGGRAPRNQGAAAVKLQTVQADLNAEKAARADDQKYLGEIARQKEEAEKVNDALKQYIDKLPAGDQCIATPDRLRELHKAR
ncbi:hypothetical protein GMDG_08755 [Pseudogymnoascus destructans 20631-21]|uniref:Uncharacterized protein n=1 Tax=Pseudogymnoascus destructans (strain ATCC MYA-4855 / 20631-21) TaxID=658429 RepID=L8GC92_PSED2|nr:hypothetical protein GMDG_08755 [Pseudogymnoascus destructans 20631-21]